GRIKSAQLAGEVEEKDKVSNALQADHQNLARPVGPGRIAPGETVNVVEHQQPPREAGPVLERLVRAEVQELSPQDGVPKAASRARVYSFSAWSARDFRRCA